MSTMAELFTKTIMTPMLPAAPRTVPGLTNASAEDGSNDSLNWWQAANVEKLCEFLASKDKKSEGMVLCDAPGLGKTLSVLATIVQSRIDGQLVIIFAGKGIVAQWAEQVNRHFPSVPIFCPDKEQHKFASASVLLEREASAGGVYVDERPSSRLPELDVLRSFDVLILAKEILSQSLDKNLGRVRALQPTTRLVVVDESHNLNKKTVTKQEYAVRGFEGVPRVLLSGTPGTTAAEVYRMLRLVGHKSLLLAPSKKDQAAIAEARRKSIADKTKDKKLKGKAPDPYAVHYNPVQENHESCVSEQVQKWTDWNARGLEEA